MRKLVLGIVVALLCLASPCLAVPTYSGTLSTADGTIDGTGNWVESSTPTILQVHSVPER